MNWKQRDHSILSYFIIGWIFGSCYGLVLFSSATKEYANQEFTNLILPGEKLIIKMNSSVTMRDNNENSKSIGFSVDGQVSIENIWGIPDDRTIFKITLERPKLHVLSRSNGFTYHKSKLEEFVNKPCYTVWTSDGNVKFLVDAREEISSVNLKKAIASFLLIRMDNNVENDSSGTCSVEYKRGERVISKIKTNCFTPEFPYKRNPETILGVSTNSSRSVFYNLNTESKIFPFENIRSEEEHTITLASNEKISFRIDSSLTLDFLQITRNNPVRKISDDELIKNERLRVENLGMKKEDSETHKNFLKLVDEEREKLKTEHLGSSKSAGAFLKLVANIRMANLDEMIKVINDKKNAKILPQLFDVFGSCPTLPCYNAVMSKLDFTKIDLCERYFWALSLQAHPNPEVIENLFDKLNSDIPEKIKETLILTIASMSYRLSRISDEHHEVFEKIIDFLIDNSRNLKPEESYTFLRAMSNLKSPQTIPYLLELVKNGTQKQGVLAWKALGVIDQGNFTEQILESARKTFLQLDKKHDSSSRTIALDIIMNSNNFLSRYLKDIVLFLASNDTSYEIKQFTLQKLRTLAQTSHDFFGNLTKILRENPKINNYSVMNPRGLSTVIERIFMNNRSGKGTLISSQEIYNSIVKRGVVDIVWEKNNISSQLFSLGIFTSGLSNFVSSEEENDDVTLGGLELTILGTQIRPFIFFNSQGELMGHVWSGTASEKTPAFQALMMLQDHHEYLCLGNGFVVELDVKGAISMDLSGKVAISLWGRSAESLVEKNAGISVIGSMKIDTSFVKSQIEFNSQLEPKLKMESDLDFSSNIKFCSRFRQEDVLLKQNYFKIQRIPGSEHELSIVNYRKLSYPGFTYSLNRKNDEMCSLIHRN